MKSEDTEKEGKIKYLVDMNYNESRLNPRLSPKDYFIGIMYDFLLNKALDSRFDN